MSTVLITGASRGIGRAIALACARSGKFSKIILNGGHDAAALQETSRLAGAAGDLLCISSLGDVGDLAYVRSLRREYGPADVLINNAGISWTGLLTDMAPAEWDAMIRTNLTSLYHVCHTYVPDMVSRGGGKILNISSVWGLAGASCEVAYSASKGAVNAFTMALAKELAPSNIQVNALAPGMVDTRMNSHLSPAETDDLRDQIPAGYIASPEEAARAAMNLLNMPPYFTGQVVKLDGAWL
jgi:3-oxoacyl-[acyl-carrier protein] reductase